MHIVLYALRFRGQAEPAGAVGNLLRTVATAPSCALSTTIGPDGVAGVLIPVAGGEATCTAEMTVTGESSFQEAGGISFGDGHRHHLRFSTVGSGYFPSNAGSGHRHGAAIWRVEGGDGQLAGASGLITSNFIVDEGLRVIDHQFAVLVLP